MTNSEAIETLRANYPDACFGQLREAVDVAIEALKSQDEYKLDEWCEDCKEYDHERHCCPRWNRVIRKTLEEAQPDRSLWFRIGEICVDESKGFISAGRAIEKIRELLREAQRRESAQSEQRWIPIDC